MVLLAAPALARVLAGAQEGTLAAMERCDGLSLLAGVVTRQERAAATSRVSLIVETHVNIKQMRACITPGLGRATSLLLKPAPETACVLRQH